MRKVQITVHRKCRNDSHERAMVPDRFWDQCGTVLRHCQTQADIRRRTRPVISSKPCQGTSAVDNAAPACFQCQDVPGHSQIPLSTKRRRASWRRRRLPDASTGVEYVPNLLSSETIVPDSICRVLWNAWAATRRFSQTYNAALRRNMRTAHAKSKRLWQRIVPRTPWQRSIASRVPRALSVR